MKDKKIIELTDDNFEDKLFSEKLYFLVDFWAEWCNPCKIFSPILESTIEEYSEKIILGKMNIDSNRIIPIKYSVRSIPTLLLFKDSKLLDTKVGSLTKLDLKNFLDIYIK